MASDSTATSSQSPLLDASLSSSSLIALNVANQLPLKLTPTNYYSWKSQFDALLFGYDLLGYIDGSHPCPSAKHTVAGKETSNPAHHLWLRQDKLLLLGIIGSLSPIVVPVIRSCTSSAEAWTRLAKNYANPSSSRIMGLAEQLSLISRGNQPVAEYLARVRDIADELALVGSPVPQQYLITHTLNGVGPTFKELTAAVRARDTVITFDELHDKLVEYEAFLKREEQRASGSLGSFTVNAAHYNSSNSGSGKKHHASNKNSSKQSHTSSNSWRSNSSNSLPNSGSQNKQPIFCQFCEKRGHTARQCFTAKCLFFPSSAPTVNTATATTTTPSNHPWLLDSGASHHVTSDLSNLSLHQPYEGPDDVTIGDGTGSLHGGTTRSGQEPE